MDAGRIARLAFAVFLCQLAGAIGSIFTFPSIPTWYASLNRPFFAPPNWVFGPVWILLFALMGISLFLVWEKGFSGLRKRIALGLFGLQLFLNALWSFVFFGLRAPFPAFAEIVFLWLAIAATLLSFARISKRAGLLLLPYLLWVSFAAILNFYFALLN